jgi:hypothetical protein
MTDFYAIAKENKDTIFSSFLSYCSFNKDGNNGDDYYDYKNTKYHKNIIINELISLFNNTSKKRIKQCIIWKGTIARKKIKNNFYSQTPVFKYKKYGIQVNAKKASIFFHSGIKSEKRKMNKSICGNRLCVNPYHLSNSKILKRRKKITKNIGFLNI